jgi:hypothetical protein
MEETKVEKTPEGPTLPPYPDGILDWTDDERKVLLFKGDKTDVLARMRHQVWHTWLLLASLRNNERLIKAVNTVEELDKDSDEWLLRLVLVQTVDRLGKVLSSTGEIAELFIVGETPTATRPVSD